VTDSQLDELLSQAEMVCRDALLGDGRRATLRRLIDAVRSLRQKLEREAYLRERESARLDAQDARIREIDAKLEELGR
jgi:hypothetical protein